MSETQQDEAIPTDQREAAAWLMRRHPWPASLVLRVLPDVDLQQDYWLDDLALVVNTYDAHQEAIERYKASTYEPNHNDEDRWEAWNTAKPDVAVTEPKITDEERRRVLAGVDSFYPMSGGEQRVVRMLATLGLRRVAWSFYEDVDFDKRGVECYLDLIRTVERTSLSVRFHTHPTEAQQRSQAAFDRFEERIARGENPV